MNIYKGIRKFFYEAVFVLGNATPDHPIISLCIQVL